MELIKDQAELTRAIKGIKSAGAKLDAQIQTAALSAAYAFEQHGNVFYINELYKALGKGARHTALTAWYTAFAGVKANTGESKDLTPFIKDANKLVDLEAGKATPWYDMKPSPAPDQVFDVLAMAMALLKKQPKEGQQAEHMKLRDRLTEVVAQYRDEVAADPAVGEALAGDEK